MSIIEDRLLGFLWAFSFLMKGIRIPQWRNHFPIPRPLFKTSSTFRTFRVLAFPLLRTPYLVHGCILENINLTRGAI